MKEMLPNFDVPSSLKLDRSGKVARSNLFENYIFPIYFPILQFLSGSLVYCVVRIYLMSTFRRVRTSNVWSQSIASFWKELPTSSGNIEPKAAARCNHCREDQP